MIKRAAVKAQMVKLCLRIVAPFPRRNIMIYAEISIFRYFYPFILDAFKNIPNVIYYDVIKAVRNLLIRNFHIEISVFKCFTEKHFKRDISFSVRISMCADLFLMHLWTKKKKC